MAKPKSRVIERKTTRPSGIGKREENRRLTSLGLSRRDDESIVNKALAIVERFRRWTNQQPCAVTGWRTGERREYAGQWYAVFVQWAHVLRKRGAWAADFGITLPLFDVLHTIQERTPDFFESRRMDASVLARAHAIRFFREHPDDARWIAEHANDGVVIELATEGLEAA